MASILRNIKVPVPIYWEFANTLEMPVLEKRCQCAFLLLKSSQNRADNTLVPRKLFAFRFFGECKRVALGTELFSKGISRGIGKTWILHFFVKVIFLSFRCFHYPRPVLIFCSHNIAKRRADNSQTSLKK